MWPLLTLSFYIMARRASKQEKLRVAFVHPDLGLGGAERLVVDAALALQQEGCDVTVYTAHHEPQRCFTETADGSLKVEVYGDWLPRHVFGRLHALFAYLRMIYVALMLVFAHQFDVVVCDQVSACIPVFKWFSKARVVFYCHFPDMLLTQRKSMLKKMYRYPLDWAEETTTGMADTVLVNSKFTASIFKDTFRSLAHVTPAVLYPSLHFPTFDKNVDMSKAQSLLETQRPYVFLSINRFERKKNLRLAIEAMAELRTLLQAEGRTQAWDKTHLVLAGGYDPRLAENVEYHEELVAYAEQTVPGHVTFLRSFSDDEKLILLKSARALIYTPENEHFGICPIEAMYMRVPVVAANSGGPMETVCAKVDDHAAFVHGRTGFLCSPTGSSFAQVLVTRDGVAPHLGENGRKRVVDRFSFNAFGKRLLSSVQHN